MSNSSDKDLNHFNLKKEVPNYIYKIVPRDRLVLVQAIILSFYRILESDEIPITIRFKFAIYRRDKPDNI